MLRLWVAFQSLVPQLDSSDLTWVDKVGTAHNFWGWQVQLHHFSLGNLTRWENLGCFPDSWGFDSWGCGVQGQGEATAPTLGNIIWTKAEIANWRLCGWALLTSVSCLLHT